MGADPVNPRKDFERESLLGRTLDGKYVIEEELGVGAMGAVFRARHLALDRQVALKVMAAELAKDPSFVERFQREAKAASRLWHPNCVAVTDFGQAEDGLLYLVMELVPGKTLNVLIEKEFPLGDKRIVSILVQLLSAVAAAHDLGIIHRDLKPENILIVPTVDDDGEMTDVVKVCDFGLAKMLADPSSPDAAPLSVRSVDSTNASGASGITPSSRKLTAFGLVLGTPAYMSPEQAMALPTEARSDLYAIGAMLYEMLTKKVPFEHEQPEEVLRLHANVLPADPLDVEPTCNADLAAICLQALEKEPMNRFPTARAMRSAVRKVGALYSNVPPASYVEELTPRNGSQVPPATPRSQIPPPPGVPANLERPSAEAKDPADDAKASVAPDPSPTARSLVAAKAEKEPEKKDHTTLVAIAGVIALAIAWYAFSQRASQPDPAPATQPATAEPTISAPPPAPSPSPSPSTTATPRPGAATLPTTTTTASTAAPPATAAAATTNTARTHPAPAPAPAPRSRGHRTAPSPTPTPSATPAEPTATPPETEPTPAPAPPEPSTAPTNVAPSAAPPPPADVPPPASSTATPS